MKSKVYRKPANKLQPLEVGEKEHNGAVLGSKSLSKRDEKQEVPVKFKLEPPVGRWCGATFFFCFLTPTQGAIGGHARDA